ncbi:hypothetical protein PFISCL1PPCAC_5386, partial [Pristionchus fissidentatus]
SAAAASATVAAPSVSVEKGLNEKEKNEGAAPVRSILPPYGNTTLYNLVLTKNDKFPVLYELLMEKEQPEVMQLQHNQSMQKKRVMIQSGSTISRDSQDRTLVPSSNSTVLNPNLFHPNILIPVDSSTSGNSQQSSIPLFYLNANYLQAVIKFTDPNLLNIIDPKRSFRDLLSENLAATNLQQQQRPVGSDGEEENDNSTEDPPKKKAKSD